MKQTKNAFFLSISLSPSLIKKSKRNTKMEKTYCHKFQKYVNFLRILKASHLLPETYPTKRPLRAENPRKELFILPLAINRRLLKKKKKSTEEIVYGCYVIYPQ